MGEPAVSVSEAEALSNRRNTPRTKVIKSAKLVFGGSHSVYDCLVLDESASGALVDLGAMIGLPEQLTIQFSNGACYPAERRWAAGTKAGLRFTGGQILTEDMLQRMRKLSDVMQAQGLPAVMQVLRSARFLDNLELRRAAEEAEATYMRLELILGGRIRT